MRIRLLYWMDRHDWHVRFPRIYAFYAWVLTPRNSGAHYGFRNWLRWVRR